MRVIGLDLSLTATGMSDGATTWLVRSTGHNGDDLSTRQGRLEQLRTDIAGHIQPPTLVILEGPSLGQGRQSGTHDRAGLWWLVVDELLTTAGVQVVEVPPAALKKYATGKGNANKGSVIDATARRFPDVDTGADDNRCDALWLAAMGIDYLTGVSVVPQAQREGLSRVRWPDSKVTEPLTGHRSGRARGVA